MRKITFSDNELRRRRISEAAKNRPKTGNNRPHSHEARRRISESNRVSKAKRKNGWFFQKQLPVGHTNYDREVQLRGGTDILVDPTLAVIDWLLEDRNRLYYSLVLNGEELYFLFVPWWIERYPGYLLPKSLTFAKVSRALCEQILGKGR